LFKPGRLDEDEWKKIRKHPELGYDLVSNFDFMKEAGKIVLHHHEFIDGTGYPKGLKGEEIPIGARIFAVADEFDALTTDRPYRRAVGLNETIAELERCAGAQFDPSIIKVATPALRKAFDTASRQSILNITFE
jgi:HD-GYP domain-containing protein (c-di-GMP phosphodiesterase class II)